MPFIVTREQPAGKLYIERQPDGEIMWTAAKRNATPMSEPEADLIASEINAHASTFAQVEGIKIEQETA